MMTAQAPILIVDDDARIREVVAFALEREGFTTVEAADGAAALEAARCHRPALIILDILMPELDGTEVCRQLRATSKVPIIFLSSRDEEVDRIVGLELGGDDYVTKPFSPRELVARVRAVLRRAVEARGVGPGGGADEAPAPRGGKSILEHGALRLDLERYEVRWNEQAIVLTVTEFGLLRTLMQRPGKVYTRDELMRGAYEDSFVTGRTIDSHIRRIRGKLGRVGADPIETVHGLGYKLS